MAKHSFVTSPKIIVYMISDKTVYHSPDCIIVSFQELQLICQSDPEPGCMESINYEDWA